MRFKYRKHFPWPSTIIHASPIQGTIIRRSGQLSWCIANVIHGPSGKRITNQSLRHTFEQSSWEGRDEKSWRYVQGRWRFEGLVLNFTSVYLASWSVSRSINWKVSQFSNSAPAFFSSQDAAWHQWRKPVGRKCHWPRNRAVLSPSRTTSGRTCVFFCGPVNLFGTCAVTFCCSLVKSGLNLWRKQSHMLRLQRTNTIHPRTSTIQTFCPSLHTFKDVPNTKHLRVSMTMDLSWTTLAWKTETHATNQVERYRGIYVFTLKWPFKTHYPSRELTYPTWGKGKSSSNVPLGWGYVSSQEGKTLQIVMLPILSVENQHPPLNFHPTKSGISTQRCSKLFWDPNAHGIHVWYIYPLYIWFISMVNAGKYTIHGSYGIYRWTNSWCSFNLSSLTSVSKDHLWHFVHKERLPRSFQFCSHHNETSEEFQWQIGFKQKHTFQIFLRKSNA